MPGIPKSFRDPQKKERGNLTMVINREEEMQIIEDSFTRPLGVAGTSVFAKPVDLLLGGYGHVGCS